MSSMKAAVVIMSHSSGGVLILKRSPDLKVLPGKWCLPGGKQNFKDESYEEIILREMDEEIGFRPTFIAQTDTFMTHDDVIAKVFLAKFWYDKDEIVLSSEHTNHIFIDRAALRLYQKDMGVATFDLLYQYLFHGLL